MQRNPGEAAWYTQPFTWTFSLIHSGYSGFSQSVRSTAGLYLDLWDIKKEIAELKKENSRLKVQQITFSNIKKENQRLRGLLKFQSDQKDSFVPAEVIGHDIIGDRDTLMINRGTQHGIKPGQAVISTTGVVGYILSPHTLTSEVLTATDRYAVIDGIVERSRARGIVEGTNKGFCQLRYLERADDVRVGDLVVTSGIGKYFPKGFPIGVVSQVKKSQYGVSQEVDINPVVNTRQLEEVFVITKTPENFKPLSSNLSEPLEKTNEK